MPLDCGQEFDPEREEEFFAALPARPGVFLVESHRPEAQPYLVRTADLRRRVERLLRAPAETTKRLNLRAFAARVRYRITGSPFEQSLAFYQHARQLFPRRYRDLARLRPPALLKVNLRNAYPRCYVTRRIFSDGAFYLGPFPTRRTAEAFASEFLNLFKMRRCQIKIRRDPSFPGCIYSEMKMCLAPCFAGCSKPEYDAEVGRVLDFLASGGASLTGEMEREREAASQALDFERAAALHKKVEKVAGILRGLPDLARKVDQLDAIIVQPAAEENTVAVFAVRGGRIADPFQLRFSELASQPRSAEEILRQHLSGTVEPAPVNEEEGSPQRRRERRGSAEGREDSPPRHGEPREGTEENETRTQPETVARQDPANQERAEHLSLLARWFYSKPRLGEIFFPDAAGAPRPEPDWPYRRIIRACSRLLAPQSSLPFPAKPEPPPGPA